MLFLSGCCIAGANSHGFGPHPVSWRKSYACPMARFRASEGCMAADVHDILFGNTLVGVLGRALATIVTIEGGPEHVPLRFGVLAALESAGKSAFIHLSHEVLELFAIDLCLFVFVTAVLEPRIVDLLLEGFSVRGTALLVVRDA